MLAYKKSILYIIWLCTGNHFSKLVALDQILVVLDCRTVLLGHPVHAVRPTHALHCTFFAVKLSGSSKKVQQHPFILNVY